MIRVTPGKNAQTTFFSLETSDCCELRDNGVRVRVLTNSLASNDVAAVHTVHARHQKQLLRCGVEFYELSEQLKRKAEAEKYTWLPGLSKSSLHARTMTIDWEKMFVGSFNFDQRSLNINTGIGVLFRDPEIASRAATHFDNIIDTVAFRVELVTDENGDEALRWTGYNGNEKVVLTASRTQVSGKSSVQTLCIYFQLTRCFDSITAGS